MKDDRLSKSDVVRSAAPAALFIGFCALGGIAAIAKAVTNSNPAFFLVGILIVGFCAYALVALRRNTYAVIRCIEEPESLTRQGATHRAVAATRVRTAIRCDRDVAFEDHAVARTYLRRVQRSRLRIALFAALSLAAWARPLVIALTTHHHHTTFDEILAVGSPLGFLVLTAYAVVYLIRVRRWTRRHPLP